MDVFFLLGISAVFSDQNPSCQDTIADGEALELADLAFGEARNQGGWETWDAEEMT